MANFGEQQATDSMRLASLATPLAPPLMPPLTTPLAPPSPRRPPSSAPPAAQDPSQTALGGIFSFLCLFFLVVYSFLRRGRPHVQPAGPAEHDADKLAKLKAALAALPELPHQEVSLDDVECAICLTVFADELQQPAIRLPCSRFHVVHVDCMAKWVDSGGSSCPLCKWLLIKDDDLEAPVMA